ncbi:hypothetical protein CPT_Moonbeam108 [Bacillus phage Moonbeam]|uniref:Uncharacterized protein n=1 Tax=Bacillus phage Moonbeam TaxID=1540091 RepID=A0A0A0RSL0_9CAUD|nr:hypothetical protein CPT_Moonbeam108 [Bacillus phage Moonbeam]AIW03506.1 hypothetical protein CPT_Moonbeam108 [Bacillus phage Moonbeam]
MDKIADLTFGEAIVRMKQGYITTPEIGSYDYYVLKQTKTYDKSETGLVLYGFDMDELSVVQEDELEIIKKKKWYVISGPCEEYGK